MKIDQKTELMIEKCKVWELEKKLDQYARERDVLPCSMAFWH